jgi:hypothetical protein
MAGLSNIHHDRCLALALWNGVDPIFKERMFGLTGPQGNARCDDLVDGLFVESLTPGSGTCSASI